MIELFARNETTYIEKTNGNLVFGNSKPLTEKGTMELVIGSDRFLIPIDENGFWRWESATPYADGNYSLSLRQIDMAGNISVPSLATVVVDSTPPEAPTLISMYDDVGADKRGFLPGETTDDKRPTLTGIAQKGTTVYLRDAEGNTIGSAVADAKTGIWVIEPTTDLKGGTNNLTLVAEETFANVTRAGTPSAPIVIVIAADSGVLPPNTITITEAFDNAGSATGKLNNGALTDDTTPTLSGAVSAGSTVTVYYRMAGSNTWTGSATATVTGENWSWTPGRALPTGNYEFQASIGANSSALFTLEIATAEQIGLRTRIESAYDDFGQDQGPLANGAITDDATPSLRGRAEANGNVIIRYMLEGGSAASVVVNADSAGNWRWTPAAELQTGVWTFDVQAQGRSSWSNAFKLEITGSGENSYAPTISYAFDDVGTSTGERKSGSSTDDTTPTLHGKAAANSVVYLQAINGAEVEIFSVIADASSQWQWTPPAELAAGDWKFQVSKGAGEGFGDAFALKIGHFGSYKNLVDFEELSTPVGSPATGVFNYKISEFVTLQTASHQQLQFIYSEFSDPPLSGKAAQLFTSNYVAFYFSTANNNLELAKKFSIELYNTDTVDARFALNFVTTSNQNQQSVWVNLKPGANVITHEDIPTSQYPKDDSLKSVILISQASKVTYLDNFTWETKGETESSTLFTTEIENNIQALDNEEFHNSSIIGQENKIDTLQLTGKDQQLDLTKLSSKIESIEIFDITGTGDNTLKLDLNALLQHGEKDLFIEDGKTQLMVKGNEGDVVQLKDILPEGSDISEWQHQEGTVTVAGVEYQVYSHGDDAELLVQQGVKTELV